MKKIIIAIVGLCTFGSCAPKAPVLTEGVTWEYTKESFDKMIQGYWIRIKTNRVANESDVREIARFTKETHTKSDKMKLFFDEPDCIGAYTSFEYPQGKYEEIKRDCFK